MVHRSTKKVEFGFYLKALTPYCTIQTPLKKYQYIIGVVMPTIILGIIPYIISLIVPNPYASYFFCISVCMLLGGFGDLLVLIRLITYSPKNKIITYIDHPYRCGLVAFAKDLN